MGTTELHTVPDGETREMKSPRSHLIPDRRWRLAAVLVAGIVGISLAYWLSVRANDWTLGAAANYGTPDAPKTENDALFQAVERVTDEYYMAGDLLSPCPKGVPITTATCMLAPQVPTLLSKDLAAVQKDLDLRPAETARVAVQPFIVKRYNQAKRSNNTAAQTAWEAALDATRAKAADKTVSDLENPPARCPTEHLPSWGECVNFASAKALDPNLDEPVKMFGGRVELHAGIDHMGLFVICLLAFGGLAILFWAGKMQGFFTVVLHPVRTLKKRKGR